MSSAPSTTTPAAAAKAAVVAAASARIGDGRSTYFDGVISAVNETAAALGARPGMAASEFAALVHAARGSDGLDG
jgi:hypothetical protein